VIAAVWALAGLLGAPPKLLVNAQVDTRSASGGLDAVFRPLLTTQPQPAWVGYEVPLARGYNPGCDYVSPSGSTAPGVIHLEPPDHALILFHVESGAVTRIRTISPDCEIDARGVPVHWLDDVRSADSTAWLETFVRDSKNETIREAAVNALAASDDPGAVDFLITLARQDKNQRIRRRAVDTLARSKNPRAQTFLQDVLK
jgi:hypothetical protein